MEYYDGIISKPSLDELYHHGVTGQKWGVRHGPPYPLNSKVSTGKSLKTKGSVKKKAQSSKSNVKKSSKSSYLNPKFTKEEKDLYDKDPKFKEYVDYLRSENKRLDKKVPEDVKKIINNNKYYDLESKMHEKERYLKNPEEWKKHPDRYIFGNNKNGEGGNWAYNINKVYNKLPITTLSLTVANQFVKKFALSDSQKSEYIKNKAKHKTLKQLQKGTIKDKETGLKLKKNQNATQEEDMNAVNFHRGSRFKTTKTYVNCAYCTTAYDLRRRGFEVHAPTTSMGVTNNDIVNWYKDAKKGEFKIPKNYTSEDGKMTASITKKELLKQPNGARGNICVRWKFGGAHSMAYEIQNKKVVFYDCQTNTKYTGKELDWLLQRTTLDPARQPMYIRTDNATPDYKKLKKKGIVE